MSILRLKNCLKYKSHHLRKIVFRLEDCLKIIRFYKNSYILCQIRLESEHSPEILDWARKKLKLTSFSQILLIYFFEGRVS
jgi:hypothetical protein